MAEARPRGDDGKAIARIMVPKGEIDFHSLKRIAELSERYGDKYVYTTNRQNFELHGVDPDKLPELQAEIDKLPVDQRHVLRAGRHRAVRRHDLLPAGRFRDPPHVRHAAERREAGEVRRRFATRPIINITGCPNSCSPYYIADIGLRGMRIREGQGSAEGYEIRLGGTQERFGQVLGEFKTEDCPRVVEAVLDTFMARRQGEETLADTVWQQGATETPRAPGMAPYPRGRRGAEHPYDQAPKPAEFSVFTGEGHAALDLKTMARDIPCQAACPAGTNVPEYIRQLVLKQPRRLLPHQSGGQRVSRRAGPHLHAALRAGLPPPVDQHQRPGDDLPPQARGRGQQVPARRSRCRRGSTNPPASASPSSAADRPV